MVINCHNATEISVRRRAQNRRQKMKTWDDYFPSTDKKYKIWSQKILQHTIICCSWFLIKIGA